MQEVPPEISAWKTALRLNKRSKTKVMKKLIFSILFLSCTLLIGKEARVITRDDMEKIESSSVQEQNSAESAFDGDYNTRWESQHGKDPQWLKVTLAEKTEIFSLRIVWENASAKKYNIQISEDGENWKDIKLINDGKEGETRLIEFKPVITKYIRILGKERILKHGYSIWEIIINEEPAKDMSTEEFLEHLQKNSFLYFINEVGDNEIIQDRMTDKKLSSTLGEAYHLTALCVAAERGWITRKEAAGRVLRNLETYKSFRKFHGVLAHYYNIDTGEVMALMHKEDDGADVSEHGFFMAGVVTCMEYFEQDNDIEKQIRELSMELYKNTEWDFMLQDKHGNKHKTLSWHWSPNYGFAIGQRIQSNMEISSMITYILAIGAPKHSIPVDCWDKGWAVHYRWGEYKGKKVVMCPPLFAHQYPHTWIDFRNKKDKYVDYFRNSVYATLANREYCLTKLYPGKDVWGLTFCDGPFDYGIYGYPPLQGNVERDATIAPTGTAGSILFTPSETISSLKYMYDNYRDRLWGKYGFYDSFSLKHNWFDKDYICFDQGVFVTNIENYRTGLIWKYFMRNKYVKNALDKIGFVGIIDDFEENPDVEPYGVWKNQGNKNAYRYNITKGYVKDGVRSLQVIYNNPDNEKDYLYCQPSCKDFSYYSYISLWVYGKNELNIILEDDTGNKAPLMKSNHIKSSDGWSHCYYVLPVKGSFNLTNIKRVIFKADTEASAVGAYYMDGIYLTNNPGAGKPGRVDPLTVKLTGNPGEVKLSWSEVGDKPYKYIIRAAETPGDLSGKDAFRMSAVKEPNFYHEADNSQTDYYIGGLEPDKKYYFAVVAADEVNHLSDISSVVSVTIKKPDKIIPIIDNFDDGKLRPPYAEWSATTENIRMSPSKEVKHDGDYSMKVSYEKESDPWAHMVADVDFRNFTGYRYLSLQVYGKVTILAKLWNSEIRQEDIETKTSDEDGKWKELLFDLSKCKGVDKNMVRKVRFFIEPGKTGCSGTFYIDSIKLLK